MCVLFWAALHAAIPASRKAWCIQPPRPTRRGLCCHKVRLGCTAVPAKRGQLSWSRSAAMSQGRVTRGGAGLSWDNQWAHHATSFCCVRTLSRTCVKKKQTHPAPRCRIAMAGASLLPGDAHICEGHPKLGTHCTDPSWPHTAAAVLPACRLGLHHALCRGEPVRFWSASGYLQQHVRVRGLVLLVAG